MLHDIRRLARRRGLSPSWPLDEHRHWEPAHLGWLAARDHGRAVEYSERVYTARWLSGDDICQSEVVQAILDDLRIPTTVDDLSTSPEIERRALAALLSVCDNDVFGVPMFVHRREKFWGIDRLADFLAASTAADPVRIDNPVTIGLGTTAEIGHAGGCG